jgi:hypothetical protein
MNSAPAELLHHLIHAALQPHSVTSLFYKHRRASAMKEILAVRSTDAAAAVTKKNAGSKAGVGILIPGNHQVFQGKSRLTRQSRDQRQVHRRAIRSSTVH